MIQIDLKEQENGIRIGIGHQIKLISKIPKIPWNRLISLIKMFQLASNSNSDAIFLFLGVDLYNRISFSDQNSKNDINKRIVSPNVHRESIFPEMYALNCSSVINLVNTVFVFVLFWVAGQIFELKMWTKVMLLGLWLQLGVSNVPFIRSSKVTNQPLVTFEDLTNTIVLDSNHKWGPKLL